MQILITQFKGKKIQLPVSRPLSGLDLFNFLKITEALNFRDQQLKMISKIQKLYPVKKSDLGSNFKFGVIWGQISDIAKSRQIIPQNEALGESFKKISHRVKKCHQRSIIAKKGLKRSNLNLSHKVDELYLKIKLLARAFQKTLSLRKKGQQWSRIAKKSILRSKRGFKAQF